MNRIFLLLLLMLLVGLDARAAGWQPAPGLATIDLWPNGAPGAQPNAAAEADMTTAKDGLVVGKPVIRLGNVSSPSITFYPPKGGNSGAAVVVFPGGGYGILAIDLEGSEVCDWLTSIQITCVLLKYRVPDSGPYPRSAAALQDAQRAIGIVRAQAAERHIDPHRIGVLGFSAGGHLVAALSTHFDKRVYPVGGDPADRVSCRPDFSVLIYPAYLTLSESSVAPSKDVHATAKTPPAFILQTEDDPVRVENAVSYFLALKNVKVPAELHLYAGGGHGYGLRHAASPVTDWPTLVEKWLHTTQMLR